MLLVNVYAVVFRDLLLHVALQGHCTERGINGFLKNAL